ncbi:putative ABC/SMC5 protein [Saccharata proteae CBS 121410]|uniref:Structural maintenance of chromosomes protein 5 n=1 Tax=Saccharata proteae CBS 121410 TaxID=1314787 RepID=A0A9P4HQ15_9PEZI|nr:putative ABC/SMC5 protein [Saccharata proteae CBS 121410]
MARLNNGLVSRRRTATEYAEDDDEGLYESDSPHGSKRVRADSDAGSSHEADQIDDQYVPLKHKPGSIVRVKLANFVTYRAAEFHLGPSLNMIIGPNGTGKSTLVCAICLGLGWSPQHLGRAKDIGEFVKHGAQKAEVEIELAANPEIQRRNPVIRRIIQKEGSKSTFFLNGEQTNQKAIASLCKSFSIQIDNLCQFLPQDRVVEFAGLSPVALLEQTQKAAAPDQMQQWHEELKSMRADQKTRQAKLLNEQEQLNNLQSRQNLQRADVERMQERQVLVEKIKVYKKIRPMVQYRSAKENFEASKAAVAEKKDALTKLESEVQPVLQSLKQKEAYAKSVSEAAKQKRKLVEQLGRHVDGIFKKQGDIQRTVEEQENAKEVENSSDRNRKAEMSRILREITKTKSDMQQAPPDFDPAAYNEKIREKVIEIRRKQEEAADLEREIAQVEEDSSKKRGQQQKLENDVKDLRTQSGQQMHKLRQIDKDQRGAGSVAGPTETAWDWIQQNRSSFRGEVFGPPILTCSVKDSRYAPMFETMLQRGDLLSITYTSREDADLLKKELLTKQNLSIYLRESNRSLDHWKPLMSKQELNGLGLDNWLIEFISGPDPVVSMLCDNVSLHRMAVTLGSHNDEQHERLLQSPITRWATRNQLCTVVRRKEYGDAAVSTMPVDLGQERELRQQITEIDHDIQELSERLENLKSRKTENNTQAKELDIGKKGIEAEKAIKQKAKSDFEGLRTRLETQLAKRDESTERYVDFRRRMAEIEKELDRLAVRKGQAAIDYARAVQSLVDMHQQMYETEIMHAEAVSDVETLVSRNQAVTDTLREHREEVEGLRRSLERSKADARRLYAESKRASEQMTDQEREIVSDVAQTASPEDLEAQIASFIARLDMFQEGDPNAVKEFETRGERIEALKEKVQGFESELEDLQRRIDDVKRRWEPELDKLVEKISDAFSYNFEKIGCAGQVGIYKADDFDQWAIQIQVKFREQEQLSLLDSHRQSGGERAVSTIFYLMALQSLARSPFRVVDEINQGMDPRNERMVHERMVEIACQEQTSQYFLITPKLLHGLRFHPRMMVHCIASGEYMPTNHSDLDLRQLAATLSGTA